MNKHAEKQHFLYELNRLHRECMVKGQYLTNVISGDVAATFDVIDICADAFLRLTQISDIFIKIASDVNREYNEGELEYIREMKLQVIRYESTARKHWNEIRQWDIRKKFPEFQKPEADRVASF